MSMYCMLGTVLNAEGIKLNQVQVFKNVQLVRHISEQSLDSEVFDEPKYIDSSDKCQRRSSCDKEVEMCYIYRK